MWLSYILLAVLCVWSSASAYDEASKGYVLDINPIYLKLLHAGEILTQDQLNNEPLPCDEDVHAHLRPECDEGTDPGDGLSCDDDPHAHMRPECGVEGTMAMWFYNTNTVNILFRSWRTDTWTELILSAFAWTVFAALYEGLKVGREILLKRMSDRPSTPLIERNNEINVMEQPPQTHSSQGWIVINTLHVLQSVIHMVQIFVGMSLMLVFMLYNIWLCLAVAVGGGIGHFCFAWVRLMPQRNQ